MKTIELAKALSLESLIETGKDITIEGVYIGDLLSVVMSKAKGNYIWITIQTHINVMAVAELLDIACIIVVENMEIEVDTLEKAKELDIPIFKTHESAYRIACKLNEMGIK
nr:serine kinase [Sedimentibacter sp.]